jgi:membrane protease YdiL (CAAX protease family)
VDFASSDNLKVKCKDWKYLGLAIRREKRRIYTLAAGLGLVLRVILVGFDHLLLVEFVEQVVYIGFIEEFFDRSYLLRRICDWLGDVRGLLITSLLFGLGDILSRVAQKGFVILGLASLLGLQSFLGGLLHGFIYLRARNIWPSAIFHVSPNMYVPGQDIRDAVLILEMKDWMIRSKR